MSYPIAASKGELNLLEQAATFSPIPYLDDGLGSSLNQAPCSLRAPKNCDISEVEEFSFSDISILSTLQEANILARDHLRELAASSAYDLVTGLAFGENYDRIVAESIRQSFIEDDFSSLPPIQILDANSLNGANGAYASEIETIFLSSNLLRDGSIQAISKVLLEEIGHFIDDQINSIDAAGDEGNIFAHLVLGQDLDQSQLAYLKQEDDSGYIWFNGQCIAVEQDNTLLTAYGVGTLSGSRSLTGWVGNTDLQDYFQFYIDTTSNFRLTLTGLSSDADVYLINSSGNTVQGSYLRGTNSELIARQLRTGTYYAVVAQYSGNTSYNLSLNATATPLDNSLSSARRLGKLVGTSNFTDWVGRNDANDYYRFDIDTTSNFQLNLTGLSADANVQLLNSAGNVVQSSALHGTSSEQILRQLSAGTYYVKVYPFSGDTTYNLALSATTIDRAGNTLSTARNIGTLSSSRSFTDWVGSIDTNDYYRFRVDTTSDFRLNLTGLSADANVRLLNSAGSVIQSSTLSGTSSERITRQLQAGTYYVRVYRLSGHTTYNLALRATAIASPDLVVIQSQNSPNTVTLGNTVNISHYTHNQGNAIANSSYVRYWLSNDTVLNTGSDRYLGENGVGSLMAGSSEYDSFRFVYNSNWGTGTRYILFEVDGYNQVSESNELNNTAYRAITVNGTSSNVPSTYRPFSASQVFSLHSHTSANHTIYLDFNGHTTQNTLWNSSFSRNSIATPAYDIDNNTTSFSTNERRNIWNIWRRVAEDFIPFNVNVTTAVPSLSDLIKSGSTDRRWGVRVVIGGNGSWAGGRYGGFAYQESFNWDSDTPAFVFSKNLYSAKHIAEAISHEVGHTLGLDHDGVVGGTEYYEGHNGWASIMGSSYTQDLTQWDKGQYSNASNREDDLTVITRSNGFGYRSDDYGNSLSGAAALTFTGSMVSTYGIIERNTDVDWFKLTSSGGSLSLNINAFEVGANLDILAKLYNSAGQVIATYNPTDSLSVMINRHLNLGTYYLSIQGTGKGNLITGYSAYGSLGQYLITGTIA